MSNEAELLKAAKNLSLFELQRKVNTLAPMAEERIAAEIEIQRRMSNNRFWRTDVWSWLGFFLAVVSLYFSVK